LAELRLSGQDLDVWPDFAVEMSSRKLFFRQPTPLYPANGRDQSISRWREPCYHPV